MILFHERTINSNLFPNGKPFWKQKHHYNRSTSGIQSLIINIIVWRGNKLMMSTSHASKNFRYRGSCSSSRNKTDIASTSQEPSGHLFWFR